MDRGEVYNVIDNEREYQESKWTNPLHKTHEVECWILYMQYYLDKAKEEITLHNVEQSRSLEMLRKVVALGVACFEIHGVPDREVAELKQ